MDTCCDFIAACEETNGCLDCLLGASTDCDDPAIVAALEGINHCAECRCAAECPSGAADECNPVSGEPCDTANESACDLSGNGNYVCFGPPNDSPACGECDNSAGPFCEPGYTCLDDNTCGKYCCGDEDCGTGVCSFTEPQMFPGGVGVCIKGT